MIPEAAFLLAALLFAAVAAVLYGRRRPSPAAWGLAALLAGWFVVEGVRTYLAPLPGRPAALADNVLLIAEMLAPVFAAEAVLWQDRPTFASVWFVALSAFLLLSEPAWQRDMQVQLPRLELIAVALSMFLAGVWAWDRYTGPPEPVSAPEFGALGIIAAALVGLVFLHGDITSGQLWATNGKVWAWMMLLIGGRLLRGSFRASRKL